MTGPYETPLETRARLATYNDDQISAGSEPDYLDDMQATLAVMRIIIEMWRDDQHEEPAQFHIDSLLILIEHAQRITDAERK